MRSAIHHVRETIEKLRDEIRVVKGAIRSDWIATWVGVPNESNGLSKRYRTERVYHEMKGEMGLDHFEGRTFPGWHHHLSVALCCYASSCHQALPAPSHVPGILRALDGDPAQ